MKTDEKWRPDRESSHSSGVMRQYLEALSTSELLYFKKKPHHRPREHVATESIAHITREVIWSQILSTVVCKLAVQGKLAATVGLEHAEYGCLDCLAAV